MICTLYRQGQKFIQGAFPRSFLPVPTIGPYTFTNAVGCSPYLKLCVNFSLVCITKTNASF